MRKKKELVIPTGAIELTKEECENIRGGVMIAKKDTYKDNESKQ